MAFQALDLSLTYSNLHLSLEARGIRISTQLQLEDTNNFLEISQTETIFDFPSGSFKQITSIPYRFTSLQNIKFVILHIIDEDERVESREETKLSLASLVCSPNPVALYLPSGLQCSAFLRVPPKYSDYIRLTYRGQHLKSCNNYALAAYFLFVLVTGKHTLLLYKSEVSKAKDVEWAPFRVSMHSLENGESLQLHVFNSNPNGRDSLIGHTVTTLSQIMRGPGSLNTHMLMDSSGKRRSEKMRVELSGMERDTGPSFCHIIRSGCDLRSSIAVDLTASNGNPLQPSSLHYIHPHQKGAYYQALDKHLPSLLGHARDARVTALGFGAKIPPQLQFSNCFPLLLSSENVMGLEGALEAYRRAVMSVQPFGPTQFADVIYHISKFAKASQNLHMNAYFVLLIFTNGCPSLCQRTVDALVDLSPHPCSVFFIAVGQDRDVENLLEAENHPLKHSDGRVAARQVALVVREEEGSEGLALLPLLVAQWKSINEMSTPSKR